MEINTVEITGWIIAGTLAVLAIIKFKLIDELVKKIISNDGNTRLYSILALFGREN